MCRAMYLCMSGHHIERSIDQPGKAASLASDVIT